MKADRAQDGLYVFPLTVRFKNSVKTLKGLVDTGSNICVCTYKIPTTLRARATSYSLISSPIASPISTLGYSLKVGFDGRSVMTHVYRLPLDMPGIDFILGLSVPSKCSIVMRDDHMEINWLDTSA